MKPTELTLDCLGACKRLDIPPGQIKINSRNKIVFVSWWLNNLMELAILLVVFTAQYKSKRVVKLTRRETINITYYDRKRTFFLLTHILLNIIRIMRVV